jgi:hypothetical protein
MKGIQDFSASKVTKPKTSSNPRNNEFTAVQQVRLPELPLEVWGPFVFAVADAAAETVVRPVREQLKAIQVP